MGSDAWAARHRAQALASELITNRPELVRVGEIDLAPALEHGLFTALRDGRLAATPKGSPRYAALARIVARWLTARRHPHPRTFASGAAILLPISGVHVALWRPVAAELAARGISTGLGWPISGTSCQHSPDAPCAKSYLAADWLAVLARHAQAAERAQAELTRIWEPIADADAAALAGLAVTVVPRLALAAAQLETMLRVIQPAVVVAYNEVGPLSRLAPGVAHARGIAAVDLPHAEAADAAAIAGIGYDAVGVFGARAVEVMEAAGVPPERIVAVGAPHVDELLRAAAEQPSDANRRVVVASQVLGGRMTPAVKERTMRGALAVAAAVAPVRLVVRPHPLETDDVISTVLGRASVPAGVEVTIEGGRPLVEHLAGAWALVTAWSNTAYEAAALGVPVIAVNATDGPPVLPLAEDSLALGAVDEPSARDAALRLLDTAARDALVRVAAERVTAHLGPLDGRSAGRAAALVLAHLRPQSGP